MTVGILLVTHEGIGTALRGVAELWSLFRGQWSTGMVPHIVFDLTVARGAYEPGPNAWGTVGHAPPGTATSALCQPPVHAIALARVRDLASRRGADVLGEVDDAIVDLYPRLVAWHRWLHTVRDPEGTGLVTILHPWESGLDNSPALPGLMQFSARARRPAIGPPEL